MLKGSHFEQPMDKLERLAYWKSVAGDKSLRPWIDEEDLSGYFQLFRPDGRGVERVFEGVARGDEVLARLLLFYYHTKDAPEDGYFVIRKPMATTEVELFEIMTQYLEKVRQIANAFEEKGLVTLLGSIQIETQRGQAPPHPAIPEPNLFYIHEIEGDWFRTLYPIPSDVLLLKEAFYFMTGHYELARYVMWPIYREATPIEDPFAPAFELWLRGAAYRFTNDKLLTVYAPLLTYRISKQTRKSA